MKTLFIFILFSMTSCTSYKKPDNSQVKSADLSEDSLVVKLPKAKEEGIPRSLFFNTQKHIISRSNGLEYEFYYGSGGRYIVVVKPPTGTFVDFALAEGTLTVAAGEVNPEIISLSVDRKGQFVGSGDTRNGYTEFIFEVFVPASRYNSSLSDRVEFSLPLKDQF